MRGEPGQKPTKKRERRESRRDHIESTAEADGRAEKTEKTGNQKENNAPSRICADG